MYDAYYWNNKSQITATINGERTMEMNEWLDVKEVSVKELDDLVTKYSDARKDYDAAKAISNEKHAAMESAKAELISVLTSAGKTKFETEGVGKVTIVQKLQVTTPKELGAKAEFFGWLKEKFGDDYIAYLSINHQTLNSLYNTELKEAADEGRSFSVPGLEQATTNTELRFSSR